MSFCTVSWCHFVLRVLKVRLRYCPSVLCLDAEAPIPFHRAAATRVLVRNRKMSCRMFSG